MTWMRRKTVPSSEIAPGSVDEKLGIPHFRVTRIGVEVEISWGFLSEVPKDYPSEWAWSIERSGSCGGPFETIASGLPSSEPTWRDRGLLPGRERLRRVFYRIGFDTGSQKFVFGYRPEWDRVLEGEEHGITWGPEGARTAHAPGVVREARQRFLQQSAHYTRRVAAMYRPAWLRGPCPVCVDSDTGTTYSSDRCTACFGSGFEGGYYSPVRVEFTRVGSPTAKAVAAPQGVSGLEEEVRASMPHWPIPEEGDIFRLQDGMLYMVDSSVPGIGWGYPIIHAVTLTQIPRTHAINKLPMPAEIYFASEGPRRQHGRVTNLEAYAESLSTGSMARANQKAPEEFDPELDR